MALVNCVLNMTAQDLLDQLIALRPTVDENTQASIDAILQNKKLHENLAELRMEVELLIAFSKPAAGRAGAPKPKPIVFDTDASLALDTTFIESKSELQDHLEKTLFPAISKHIRLYKTTRQRQDEYLVIDHDWLGDDLHQSYAVDRDVIDRLAAYGIPPVITYLEFQDNKPTPAKYKVLAGWRRHVATQMERLTGLCYQPGPDTIIGSKFNTYRDVSVPAIDGCDISEMMDHLFENICDGNDEYFQYLIRYLAHMVQKPHERPMTGIAIIGGEGTGKGIVTTFLKRMMGGDRNVNTTASSDDTRNFNSALGNKLLVVFDEATFSGDRKQSDFMKKLISEPRIRIEQKGIDAYESENFTRVLITSNNMQSAVPATIGARRWLILECKNELSQIELAAFAMRIGNKPGAPTEEPGYVNAFKHRLMTMDIEDFDPTKLPKQNTGFETKLHNHYKENPVYAFLCEWLTAPSLTLYQQVLDEKGGDMDKRLRWDGEVVFSTFYAVFKEACKACFANVPGPNLMRGLLERYGITVRAAAGNVRHLYMPFPMEVLKVLERSARFDIIVTDEQREVIRTYEMFSSIAQRAVFENKPTELRLSEKERAAYERAFQLEKRDAAEKAAAEAGVMVQFIDDPEAQQARELAAAVDDSTAQLQTLLKVTSLALVNSPPIEPEPVDEGTPWFVEGASDWMDRVDDTQATDYGF